MSSIFFIEINQCQRYFKYVHRIGEYFREREREKERVR